MLCIPCSTTVHTHIAICALEIGLVLVHLACSGSLVPIVEVLISTITNQTKPNQTKKSFDILNLEKDARFKIQQHNLTHSHQVSHCFLILHV
jgi:hypothetical protein